MKALKAHVMGGRVVLDEPTELPDGTEVELTVIEDDDFEPGERARLDAAFKEVEGTATCAPMFEMDATAPARPVTGIRSSARAS